MFVMQITTYYTYSCMIHRSPNEPSALHVRHNSHHNQPNLHVIVTNIFFSSLLPHSRQTSTDEKGLRARRQQRACVFQRFPADPKTNRSSQLIVFN